MKKEKILSFLNKIAPFDKGVERDNIGELVKGPEKVDCVIVCLDLSEHALSSAKKHNADMVITHHPVIWEPLSKIDDDLLIGAIKNDISVVCLHTNYDAARLNDILAKKCLIENPESVLFEDGIFLGRKGHVKECTFNEYMNILNRTFPVNKTI